MKMRIMIFLAVLLFCTTAFGAITYNAAYYLDSAQYRGSGNTALDPIYLNINEVATLLGATAGTTTASKAVILGTTNNIDTLRLTPGAAPASPLEGDLFFNTSDHLLYFRNASAWVSAGAGTFAGGNITSDVTFSVDGVDILPTNTTAETWSIQVYDVDDIIRRDVLRWTNGNTGAVVLGAALDSLAIASTGLNVSTAGAVTGVTALTATGVQTINASGTSATNIGTGTYSGAISIGNNLSSLAFATSAWDLTSAGALSGITTLSLSDDITMATGQGLKPSTTTAESVGIYGYDTDGAYVGALVVTNSATPATVLGNTDGTTAISSSDWTVSTAGNMAGIGTIASNGLITASGGLTLTGTTSINDTATTSTTSIGGGTTTGTITIGSSGTQALDIGNGAGIKTVALGSTNTSSITTIKGGSAGVNINTGTFDDPTSINTGLNTGTVTIGGTGAMTIAIGNGGTGAKVVALGDSAGASSLALNAGTEDMTITSVDDMTINGGSAGSIINLGTNTHGNVINIGTNNTALDDINIGSALDTPQILGVSIVLTAGDSDLALSSSDDVSLNGGSAGSIINVGTNTEGNVINIGTNDTTLDDINIGSAKDTPTITGLAIELVSGATGISLNAATSQPVNVATGNSTGTVTVGGTGTQAIDIGSGVGIKTVTLGSATTTSGTTISGGSATGIILNATGPLNLDAGTTFDMLATGAFSIDGSNAASNISLATNSADDDFTIGLTGATDSSIIVTSTGTGSDAVSLLTTGTGGGINMDTADGAVSIVADGAVNGNLTVDAAHTLTLVSTDNGAAGMYLHLNGGTSETLKLHSDLGTGQDSIYLLSDVGGVTITASAVPTTKYALKVSGNIAGATHSEGVGLYSEANITGNLDGKTYASGSWMNITGGTPTGPSLLAALDIGIYTDGGPTLSAARIRVLNVEYQVNSGDPPLSSAMMHFNADVAGDVPDYWFSTGNSPSVVFGANTTHTTSAKDKLGAIKIYIGDVGDAYIYVYSSAGS